LRDRKLLLVKRRRPPEAGCWGLPGGKVDWLEPVPNAVSREIAEEFGLAIKPHNLLCVVDQIDRDSDEHWVAAGLQSFKRSGTVASRLCSTNARKPSFRVGFCAPPAVGHHVLEGLGPATTVGLSGRGPWR
jgi:ADP-ribose pyrophosphatase YjhB (NUDIX family)